MTILGIQEIYLGVAEGEEISNWNDFVQILTLIEFCGQNKPQHYNEFKQLCKKKWAEHFKIGM